VDVDPAVDELSFFPVDEGDAAFSDDDVLQAGFDFSHKIPLKIKNLTLPLSERSKDGLLFHK
jgi:hypothetical protein